MNKKQARIIDKMQMNGASLMSDWCIEINGIVERSHMERSPDTTYPVTFTYDELLFLRNFLILEVIGEDEWEKDWEVAKSAAHKLHAALHQEEKA